jgi:hypothetical protein
VVAETTSLADAVIIGTPVLARTFVAPPETIQMPRSIAQDILMFRSPHVIFPLTHCGPHPFRLDIIQYYFFNLMKRFRKGHKVKHLKGRIP